MEIIVYTLRSISSAIISPPLVFVLMILIIIFYFKNKKVASMQKIIVGGIVNSAIELTLSQFVLGTIGGIFGSIILVGVGVKFNYESGIQYLFLISILLTFIKPKYICFSYSASILGLISILFKTISNFIPYIPDVYIFKIDIAYLLLFVGVLHAIEGILVMIDGHRGALPVFSESENTIIGGYALKRYWIVPISMFYITMKIKIPNSIEISMDILNRWQVLNMPSVATIGSLFIMPLYAMVGYSSTTFTKSKREKSLSNGSNIFIYGICVIIVSLIARRGIMGEIIAIIFVPAAHEFMLKKQRDSEKENNFKFVSNEEGLVILDISNDSQMNQYGLEIGDRILFINDKNINSEKDIYLILKENLYRVNIKVKKKNGEIYEFNHIHDKNKRLGILLVPKKVLREESASIKEHNFKTILEEIKKVKDSQNNT